VKPLPAELANLARAAVADEFGAESAASYAPDAAIVNLYGLGAKLGLHLDGKEPSDAPVVTLSLGAHAKLRRGRESGGQRIRRPRRSERVLPESAAPDRSSSRPHRSRWRAAHWVSPLPGGP